MVKAIVILAISVAALGGIAEIISKNLKNGKLPGAVALVELFTSEGCSSCPPADEALALLEKKFGSNLVVVGYHVDYWDHLGWKDPYSDRAYTLRQQDYGTFFGLNGVYTPQAVVNGQYEMVGSDQARLTQVIENELKKNNFHSLDLDATVTPGGELQVNYKTTFSPGDQLNLCLIQLSGQDQVTAGENKGRLLHHINIARSFHSVSPDGGGGQAKVTMSVPAGLSLQECRLIGWLQNSSTRKLSGVTEISIPHP